MDVTVASQHLFATIAVAYDDAWVTKKDDGMSLISSDWNRSFSHPTRDEFRKMEIQGADQMWVRW